VSNEFRRRNLAVVRGFNPSPKLIGMAFQQLRERLDAGGWRDRQFVRHEPLYLGALKAVADKVRHDLLDGIAPVRRLWQMEAKSFSTTALG